MTEKSLNRSIKHQIRKTRSSIDDNDIELKNDVLYANPEDMRFLNETE